MQKLKQDGQVSRAQFNEVKAEAAHLASRAVKSVRAAWEEEDIINRPDLLVKWCQKNISQLQNIVYLGSEKHPQMTYKRARIGGVTPGELMDSRLDFEDLYGIEYGSIKARAAYEALMNGVQHNMRWNPEKTLVPTLSQHYFMDSTNRLYALGAQGADTQLMLNSFGRN